MRDKQIEEMAKVIKSSLDGLGSGNFNFTGDEISTMFAKALYNAGYHKASEVIDEVVELLEELKDYYRIDEDIRAACGVRYAMIKVDKLKKKYESENRK